MMQAQKRIGHYRLVEALGTGGMGTVFKAYDELLERPVAIKVIRHDRTDHPRMRGRLEREARALAAVNHPFLVQIYELMEWEDDYVVVMELVEGVTLASHLRDGPLEVEEAVRLLSEVTEGLCAIHERSLLHRDLKSDNVIITAHGHVKIMDFGLADVMKSADSENAISSESALSGTPSILSPEAILGNSLDSRSDLFSLGVLAYEALTGARPFGGGSTLQTLMKIVREDPVPVRERRQDVPTELSDLVDRLLEKDPDDRPASAREVLAALRELFPRASSGTLSPRKSPNTQAEVDPWTQGRPGTSASSIDIAGSGALEAPAGLSWTGLSQWLRLAYYRLRPTAAYRRHAVLVDKCFQESLSADDERELTALEEHLDRLEESRYRAVRDDLVHLRDELKARKSGHG